MQLGRVIGTVVATQKYETLSGIALKVIQPCDELGQDLGDVVVACDPVHARDGDTVIWVGKREASLALPGAQLVNLYPVDATVTGIVDAVGSRRTT